MLSNKLTCFAVQKNMTEQFLLSGLFAFLKTLQFCGGEKTLMLIEAAFSLGIPRIPNCRGATSWFILVFLYSLHTFPNFFLPLSYNKSTKINNSHHCLFTVNNDESNSIFTFLFKEEKISKFRISKKSLEFAYINYAQKSVI